MKIVQKNQKMICLIVFSLYISIVLYLTIFRFNFYYDKRQLNLTLFIDLINIYQNVGTGEFFRLFLGNIGWFIPFGFLFPMLLKRKSLFITMSLGLTFSFFIETIQFISYKGVAELDDLILNTLGTAIGHLSFKLSHKFISKKIYPLYPLMGKKFY